MLKYNKEIENLINSVKNSNNDYFKKQKDIKFNENSITILENKVKKLRKQKQNV